MLKAAVQSLVKKKFPGRKKEVSKSFIDHLIMTRLKGIRKRRTKVLDISRKYAQDPKMIHDWFVKYDKDVKEGGFDKEPGRVWNFDESGFRVGMSRGYTVYIPEEAPPIHVDCPANRTEVTIVEGISANGRYLPPYIIVQGKYHLKDWYNSRQDGSEVIEVSDTEYTNKDIGVEWLKHFIQHAGLEVGGKPTMLLMDGHCSHNSDPFKALAHDYNIWLYEFPSHMTHIMQPLDVTVFQPYKHWHGKAVNRAAEGGQMTYTIPDFLRDLPEIREKTFRSSTITSGFENSGLIPPNEAKTMSKMKQVDPK